MEDFFPLKTRSRPMWTRKHSNLICERRLEDDNDNNNEEEEEEDNNDNVNDTDNNQRQRGPHYHDLRTIQACS